MSWPEGMHRGALLAAMVLGDSRLDAAKTALPERDAILALAERLSPSGDKRALLKTLAGCVEPIVDVGATENPRARALLATRVPRETGQAWLADAPRARRGFVPSRGLSRSVAHATRARMRDEDTGADLGAGRTLLAAALRAASDDERPALLADISAGEAASLLALAAHDDSRLAPTPEMLAAAAVERGDARVAALGRIARGARARRASSERDPMARAGRELAELGLATGGDAR